MYTSERMVSVYIREDGECPDCTAMVMVEADTICRAWRDMDYVQVDKSWRQVWHMHFGVHCSIFYDFEFEGSGWR